MRERCVPARRAGAWWPGILLMLAFLAGGCAAPVRVERVDHRIVHHQITSNVLSADTLSGPTRNVLRQWSLTDQFDRDPEPAIADLHGAVAEGRAGANEIFALAELAFFHAEHGGGQPHYLAAAVYAYAYLFPGTADVPPDPYDPRFRLAADLYNRGLTSGLITGDGTEVAIQAARYRLPFGVLDVGFDRADLRWGGRELQGFFPIAEVAIDGLDNRYRQPGIGAPLAAGTAETRPVQGFQVAPRAKVPVTALLRLDDPRRQLASGRMRAALELYAASETDTVLIDRQRVPLEVEYTATLAYMLSGSQAWSTEYRGFLLGDLLSDRPTRLVALDPYHPGRFPVVFVHGTASSVARWADMLNDLNSDPRIRDHFQFWFFSYETGNPVVYSAMLLREELQNAVSGLDPAGTDPALREMVVIGHSQGGLLTKMTAIDSGHRLWDGFSRKPLEELRLSPENRDLLRRALFVEPVPAVRRLIFIATPHGGSYVAGNPIAHYVASLVRVPLTLLRAGEEILQGNREALLFAGDGQMSSVYGMTPGSPLVRALAQIPVAPGVKAHSIIAVRGDGPVESGDDGVVEYASAHIDAVESEDVVRSGHSTQSNPNTIAAVRRILLLHLAEACARSRTCPPAPSTRPVTAPPVAVSMAR